MADTNHYHRPFVSPSGQPGSANPGHDRKSPREKLPALLSLNDDPATVFLDKRHTRTTTATRLFRNQKLLDATRMATDEFIRSERAETLRMWSTGCSSGEEVYSMAMIALDEFEQHDLPPRLDVSGSDINLECVHQARKGSYLRPSPGIFQPHYWHILKRYAMVEDTSVTIGEQLRTVCRFVHFDLRVRPKRNTFHFIVCNHVLQYYDTAGQRQIVENLASVLKPKGYLYLEGLTGYETKDANLEPLKNYPNTFTVPTK